MKKLIMWCLIVLLCITQYINVFCDDIKIEYQFDEIVVTYAVQFKALPCSIQSDSWLTQLAGGIDKPLDIIYGEVNYKMGGQIFGSEKYIKITGANGSNEKLLAESGSYERSPDTNEIVKEISQLCSYKIIDGNSVVKDTSGILKSVIMQEEFNDQHKIKSITLKNGESLSPINTDEPLFDVYTADLDSVVYFDSETNQNNTPINSEMSNTIFASATILSNVDFKMVSEDRISLNNVSSTSTSDMFEQAISDSLRLYGIKLIPLSSVPETPESDFTWNENTITKYTGSNSDVVIPSKRAVSMCMISISEIVGNFSDEFQIDYLEIK